MYWFSRVSASWLPAALVCICLDISAAAQVALRSVKVLGSKDNVEIEVESSDRIVPQTQVLTGPDRLVIDFPNALPNGNIRNQSVDRGEVKDVRVGLFQSRPPVTRVVLDLKTARSYQVFPYGRTVMIKVLGDAAVSSAAGNMQDDRAQPAGHPGLIAANYSTGSEPIQVESATPVLEVSYRDGLLGIHANKATLSEILYAVQQRTGADISIAAGAEQEKVVADINPAPAPEVLARLLNGCNFNFLILSAPNDTRHLDRVILSTKSQLNFQSAPPQPQTSIEAEPDRVDNQTPNMAPPGSRPGAEATPPHPQPETAPPEEDESNK